MAIKKTKRMTTARKAAKPPAKKHATASQKTGVRNVPAKTNPISGRSKATGPGTGSGRHFRTTVKKNVSAGQSPAKARTNAMSSLVGVQNTVAGAGARKKKRMAAAKRRGRSRS